MTESILKALMRLFAIVSQMLNESKLESARIIVESYLKQLVAGEKVSQYLYIYDFYFKEFRERGKTRTRHKDPLYTIKSVIICNQVNSVLIQKQKVHFLLQLLDMIGLNEKITEFDYDYIKTVSYSFNIEEKVFQNCMAFIIDSYEKIPEKNNVLLIDNGQSKIDSLIKRLKKDVLTGQIIFLHIPETDTYVFRHIRKDDMLYLNGRNILPGRTYILDQGASIHSPFLGSIHYSDILKIYLSEKVDHRITLTATNLEFRFKKSEKGIMPFSLTLESGQIIGIMGGSGVGKSTLLNLLNGNLKPANGKVTINGYDVHYEKDKIKGIIGYIPQDDLLIEELTVFQNLYFNAKLCFNDFDDSQIKERVNSMLKELGLYESGNLKVGNALNRFISGGQRKRLNISLELLREPYLLFVDEPTSGLSSTDSELVMDLLNAQSLKGKLVIVNIHQPSSDIYKSFDKIIVLDQGGAVIYFGNPADALVYFKSQNSLINAESGECLTCGNINPEEVLQTVEMLEVNEFGKHISKRLRSPDEWYTLFRNKNKARYKNLEVTKYELPPILFKTPERFRQFIIFLLRNLKTKITDTQYLIINLLEAPILAFILAYFTKYNKGTPDNPHAYLFSENVNLPVYIFMSVIVALFLGMMVSAEEIIRDRKIIAREAFLNLSKFSYFNSKVFFLICLSALQSFLFVLTGNWIMGIENMFFSYWLMLFSVSAFSNLVGLIISDNLKTVVSIYILIPLLLVPQILLGGAMVKFDKLNSTITTQKYVPVLGDIFASRWAYEGLTVHQFKNNAYEKLVYNTELKESNATYYINYLIPELQLLNDECLKQKTNKNIRGQLADNLNIIKNELSALIIYNRSIPIFKNIDKLNINIFDKETSLMLKDYLSKLRLYYVKVLNNSVIEKDKIFEEQAKQTGGKVNLILLKQKNYNKGLADLLLNKHENDKILYYKNRIIRKTDPVFYLPESRNGRAHLYAPEKRVGSFLFSTYWFNLAALWVMNVVLFLFLQYGLFSKAYAFIKNQLIRKYDPHIC